MIMQYDLFYSLQGIIYELVGHLFRIISNKLVCFLGSNICCFYWLNCIYSFSGNG